MESFKWAKNGLRTVWKEEKNFRIEIFIGLLAIVFSFILDISRTDFVFILISIIIVITAEIVNTAIEDVCNKIEPNHDPVIGKIKDIMAGFVLTSSIGAFVIGIIIFIPYLF